MLFQFFALRQVPKTRFPDFYSVGRCRSSVFWIFSSSAPAEELFFQFSLRRWVPKRCFCDFEAFARGRNVVLIVFSAFPRDFAHGRGRGKSELYEWEHTTIRHRIPAEACIDFRINWGSVLKEHIHGPVTRSNTTYLCT